MAERREEEEGGEGVRQWSSGGLYRPRSSWARDVATGGGRFGSGAHDGERAELPAARRRAGGVVAARGAAWDACAREEVPRGGPGGAGDFPGPFGRGHTVDEVHRRRTAGGGRNRASREREMETGALLRFLKIPGTSRKSKIISYLEGSNGKVLNTTFA